MSITQDPYAQRFGCTFIEGGGVTSARGFTAAGVHAGFKADPAKLDLALVVADEPCAAAGVFTRNVFCAAPVQVCRERLNESGDASASYGTARAVVVNSGGANAATGEPGRAAAREEARIVGAAVGCPEDEVLMASTGVIGVHLPLDPFRTGVPAALEAARTLSAAEGGASAARAIMTTDTHPKECAVTFTGDGVGYDGVTFTVGGMAKGSGMIMPNMATMIAVITTDAPVAAPHLHAALKRAVDVSFNKITVDSDTSTNDSCFCLASGAAARTEAAADASAEAACGSASPVSPASPALQPFDPESPAFARFQDALMQVCTALARAMATDGEGATRLVTVNVRGAASGADADAAARTVANSPLVKTAIYGHDANWGRVAAALGRSGARFAQEDADIDILGLPVCRAGLTVPFDEDEALARFEAPEVVIDADLHAGSAAATVWTCDFSHEYVSINGDYRS
ncbi:MAG: bifunctional ornithine acetyltransferase/N-acetylglutamate synthase [Eggerthellaceae bacterium]|nr:bifunctional ornithine acetyltransferase/N-acetylglutamate synthase [Eggerthellaceae bacterium]